jgi:predicted RNA-binding protein (TIGR00451 family)
MNSDDSIHGPIDEHARFSPDVVRIVDEVFRGAGAAVLESLAKPVRTYYVRCNTLKISPVELRSRLERLGLNIEQNPAIPEALGIQVDGPFAVPPTNQKIVVDKRTAESALQGANVYTPGILNCGAMCIGDKVTIVSELGDVIATGQAMLSANDVLTFRKGLAIRVDHGRFIVPHVRELSEFSQGLLYPQSLAAMATVRVLDPKPDETIVDVNCAPGGKLSHISQLMNNSGKVFGFDRNSQKIDQARKNVTILGCRNVVLGIHDSRYLHEDFSDLKADRVLIDPPCSALGLRPKVHDFTTLDRVNHLADYQKQFIKAASEIVRPGGVIVYSVCTFTPQECEQAVKFAEQECALQVVEQNPFLGSKGLFTYGPTGLSCQRFHPHTHEIGYFIAKFLR